MSTEDQALGAAHPAHPSPGALTLTWALLIGLTILMWWFDSSHQLSAAARFGLTTLKVLLIAMSFMNLWRAQRVLLVVLTLSMAALCAGLLGLLGA